MSPSPTPIPPDNSEFVIKVEDADLEQARTLARAGKWREAVGSYSQALQKGPEDRQAWRELGEVYLKLGRRDFALRCFEESLRLDPSDLALKAWLDKNRQKLE